MTRTSTPPAESVVFTGKIHAVLQKQVTKNGITQTYERVVRPPGVRLIITKGDQILLSREYREELQAYDYRLPGGKVYDTYGAYADALAVGMDMTASAADAALREAREEVGLVIHDPKLLAISRAGATITWDLYYFHVTSMTEIAKETHEHEQIATHWCSFDEASELALTGNMQEDRSASQLLQFIRAR